MSIQTRLILSLSTLALALVLSIVLSFQWRFDRGLLDYVNAQQQQRLRAVSAELADRWRDDPGWTALQDDPRRFHHLLRRTVQRDGSGPPENRRNERPRPGPGDELLPRDLPPGNDPGGNLRHLRDAAPPPPIMLFDASRHILFGPPEGLDERALETTVEVDGRIVGYVATPRSSRLQHDIDRQFRAAQLHTLWLVGGLALLGAIVVAVLLARNLTRPLRQLSRAAHRLTQQQYNVEVDASRRDELGALARDIHELAQTLSRNADMRQRWFADISHELRTPLAVLRGEIEALLDGVRPLTRDNIESLRQEAGHLQRLIEDLYVLARADLGALQYHKTTVDLSTLVRERIDAAMPAIKTAGLTVNTDLPDAGIEVNADEDRLQQLIDNLLINSVRYTDRGGRMRIALATRGDCAELVIEDSAPGVPDAALKRLFDHLYRVDEARTRSSGGAGLGLAICRRIVDAHGGRIEATHSPLGGVRIAVMLPLSRSMSRGAKS